MAAFFSAKAAGTACTTIKPPSEPVPSLGIVKSRIQPPFAFANNLPYLIPFVEYVRPYIINSQTKLDSARIVTQC